MRIEFPSIVNTEKYLFVYDSEKWDSTPVCRNFRYQEKTRDGYFRYANPIPVNLTSEYLASLAVQMMENDELCQSINWSINRAPEIEDIAFASKVVYNSKKTKYYSKSLRRVSAVRSKQYDRRFEPVREELDGSPTSVLNILYGENGNSYEGLTRYIFAKAVREWWYASRKRYRKFSMDDAAEIAGLTDSYDESCAVDSAWDACKLALQVWQSRKDFKSRIDNFKQRAMITKLGENN